MEDPPAHGSRPHDLGGRPPSSSRTQTPSQRRDGYKAYIAAEPATGIVTACEITPDNIPDGDTGLTMLKGELSATEVIADSAYGSGKTRAALEGRSHRHCQTQTCVP